MAVRRRGGRLLAAGAITSSFLLVSASAAVAAPLGASGSSSTPAGSTAKTLVSLPSLSIVNPLLPGLGATLGSLEADATSVPDLLSGLSLQDISALGKAVPGQQITSAGGAKSGNLTVPVTPSGAPLAGTLSLGNYAVSAAAGTAKATVGALTGGIQASPVSLATTLGQHGLGSIITPDQASSNLGVGTPGLNLNLGDLLPTNVLDNLPLGTVVNLVSSLKLPLSSGLLSQVTQLNSLTSVLGQLTSALGQLSGAQATLTSLLNGVLGSTPLAGGGTLGGLQSTVTGLLGTVTGLLGGASTSGAVPSSVQGPLSQLTSADGTLLQTVSSLVTSDPTSPLAAPLDLVQSLTGTVQGLLGQLTNLIPGLPNLSNLLNSLLGLLKTAPLLNLGQVSFDLASMANGTHATSGLNCTMGPDSLLGLPLLGGSGGTSCNQLTSLLGTVSSTLSGVLGNLPVVGSLVSNVVSVSGLKTTMSASSKPDASGTTTATAAITPLQLSITPLGLLGNLDPLLTNLLGGVNQLLGATGSPGVANLPGVSGLLSALSATHASQASTAAATGGSLPTLGPLSSLLGILGTGGLPSLSGLTSLLSGLVSQLVALPSGSLLKGLSTLGVKASLIGASTEATFRPGAAAVVPGAAAQPGSQAPVQSPASKATPAHSLPFTGAETAGMVALGMLTLAAGAYLATGDRRSRLRFLGGGKVKA